MDKKSQKGMTLIWTILAGALIIAGMEIALISRTQKRTQDTQQVPQPGELKKEVGEKREEFVGKIEAIIAMDKPVKCTYTQEGFSGVSFIKGKKMYSEITQSGESGYTIVKDNCMWNWGWGAEQGTKICFGGDIWETPEAIPAGVEYQCVPFTFSDLQFDPPANINFITTGETAPPSGEDLLKILPPKERSELESAIREAQQVLKNIEIFTPPTIDDIKESLRGLNQINKQATEQIQKNIERSQQEFQPLDPKKIEEYFNQNPPAVPPEVKQLPPEAQEYYYRKYILKDPAFQY